MAQRVLLALALLGALLSAGSAFAEMESGPAGASGGKPANGLPDGLPPDQQPGLPHGAASLVAPECAAFEKALDSAKGWTGAVTLSFNYAYETPGQNSFFMRIQGSGNYTSDLLPKKEDRQAEKGPSSGSSPLFSTWTGDNSGSVSYEGQYGRAGDDNPPTYTADGPILKTDPTNLIKIPSTLTIDLTKCQYSFDSVLFIPASFTGAVVSQGGTVQQNTIIRITLMNLPITNAMLSGMKTFSAPPFHDAQAAFQLPAPYGAAGPSPSATESGTYTVSWHFAKVQEELPAECKDKQEVKTITSRKGKGTHVVWRLPGQSGVFYKSRMEINADGSPRAYRPDGQGIDNLKNAGRPGNWWGVATDTGQKTGTPVVQGPNDSYPGYWVSTTALQDRQYPKTDPRRYVDSEHIPYIVIPRGQGQIATLGDFAAVYNTETGALAYAIVADLGPQTEIGEGSIALAQALGHNPFGPKGKANSGIDGDKIDYLIFPGSGNRKPRTVEEITSEGQRLFEQWGGRKRLEACLP